MRVLILAGGRGRRLWPLTLSRPKPMLPVGDRPLLAHLLERLRAQGFPRAELLAGARDDFRAAFPPGMRLTVRREVRELGTAGAVRAVVEGSRRPLLVLMGDLWLRLDLRRLMRHHREAGGLVTLALLRRRDPGRLGYARRRGDTVERFVEKPGRVAPGFLASAGIYVVEPAALSWLPPGQPRDFGREVLPRLCEAGFVRGCLLRGTWRDVGEVRDYLAVQGDMLTAGTGLLLGADSRVGATAQLRPPVVLGRGCRVERGARLEGCVLWDGVQVEAGAVLERCVLADGCMVGEGARVGALAMLGARVSLGAGSTVEPNTRVPPDVRIPAGRRVGPADLPRRGGPRCASGL